MENCGEKIDVVATYIITSYKMKVHILFKHGHGIVVGIINVETGEDLVHE